MMHRQYDREKGVGKQGEPNGLQKKFDFEQAEALPAVESALPQRVENPRDWEDTNPLHLNRTTFKGERFYGPGEKERLRKNLGRREKKTNGVRDDTHDLIADLMHPASVAEQAQAVMSAMSDVEARKSTQALSELYPMLTSIRTALAKLDVLHPSDKAMTQVRWNAPINNERTGTTYAEQFAGTFHFYTEEILPMLAEGTVKTGAEAIDIHEHHVHEATAEAIRKLADKKSGKK